jgi:lipopolysaccharide export system protein LptA
MIGVRAAYRPWKTTLGGSLTLVFLLLAATSSSAPLIQIGADVLDVSAKQLDVDLAKGVARLDGGVRIKLGELDVSCDRVDIRYDDAPIIRWARGSGSVRASMRGITATAQSLEVEIPERRVRLVGDVKISRGKGWVQAEHASIDLPTGRITLDEIRGSIPIEAKSR